MIVLVSLKGTAHFLEVVGDVNLQGFLLERFYFPIYIILYFSCERKKYLWLRKCGNKHVLQRKKIHECSFLLFLGWKCLSSHWLFIMEQFYGNKTASKNKSPSFSHKMTLQCIMNFALQHSSHFAERLPDNLCPFPAAALSFQAHLDNKRL